MRWTLSIRIAFLGILLPLGLLINNLFAQQKEKERLEHLQSTIQAMELSGREMSANELLYAIQQNEDLLLKHANDEFTPNLLFQLSELYIRKAKYDLEQAMAQYEKDLEAFQNKKRSTEPQIPTVNFGDALHYLYQILDNYSNVAFIDKVLYRIALCHQEENNLDKSIQFYKRLMSAAPLSPFAAEAYFRLGEIYFNRGQYQQAINFYSYLVSEEMWSNPFYDMSLYKLGWSYYNLNQYPEAISYFFALLKDLETLQRVKTQRLNQTAIELQKESLRYIAVSFAEYADPSLAFTFLDSLASTQYQISILSQLGEIYLKQDQLDEAIQTFRHLINKFPKLPEAPFIAQKIVEAFEQKWDLVQANEARSWLIDHFYQGSEWYAAQTDSLTLEKARKIVKTAIYKKATYHQLQAREANNDPGEYEKAITLYRKYLEFYPEDSLAYKVNFYLAECYYNTNRYELAGEEYKKIYTRYGDNEYTEEAGYAAVLSFYKASENYTNNKPLQLKLTDFFGLVGEITIDLPNSAVEQFILTCNEVVKRMPHNPKVVDILMKEAEVLNEINRHELSRQIYMHVAQNYPNSDQFARAVALVAQSYFLEEDYEQAEKWYHTVVTVLPDTLELVKRARIQMVTSRYKLAEKLSDAGDKTSAAAKFAQTALDYPGSQMAELALTRAAETYEELGDTLKAAELFEKFSAENPESPLVERCALQAAKYRESLSQWEKAAENYMKICYMQSSNRILALFKAADCYFLAGNYELAINHFKDFLELGTKANQRLEALLKIGLGYYEQEDYKNATSYFENCISLYNANKDQETLNTFYPSQAQFMLGEIAYIQFKAIELVQPLTDNFKRKTAALQKALKNYQEAAKYKIAEWTTASFYKIAKLFEDFAQAMMVSPYPPDLTEEQKIQYELSLKQRAREFQVKAYQTYQSNIRQATKNNIENKWVILSKNRLSLLASVLNPESLQKDNN